MDPKDQPQFNPKVPVSEVLKQEQSGFVPSQKKASLNDVVAAMRNMYAESDKPGALNPESVSAQPKIIKTYKSDAAEAVRAAQHMSVAKIAIAQEQERVQQNAIVETPKKKFGLLLMTIILVALGAIAIPTVQYFLNQKKQEVAIVAEKTILPFDRMESVVMDNLTREDLLGSLDVVEAKPKSTFSLQYRKILKKVDINPKILPEKVSAEEFASVIGPTMPSALARAFDGDYMYGVLDSKEPKPFFIFKVSSFQQTFANMLKWENSMTTDLSPIMNLDTTLFSKSFSDQVVINKDVRAITSFDGQILFLYGFLDNQTLVVATSPKTFEDLNSRYISKRFVQ